MHVRVIVMLALRNLRRHLRRSVLTASAMMVGGALLVFSISFGDGGHEQWIESGVRLGSGHVTVEHPEYRVSRRIDHRLTNDVRHAAEQALQAPDIAAHIVAASVRLSVSALASSAAGARPAQIVAVNPVAEAAFGTVDEHLVEGRYLKPDDTLSAYVGAELVESLELRIGSRFVVQAQDTEREIAGQLLRVTGIFRSGVPEVDQTTIHIPLETAGAWLGSGMNVTNVGVVLDHSAAAARVAGRLERALAGPVADGDARVMGWREADPALSAAIAIDDFGNYLIQGFLFVIIAFAIVNTVLMSVMLRSREFGVLQALGLTPGQTGAVVLIEGLTLSVASGLLGVGLGLLFTWSVFGDGLDMSVMMENIDQMTFSGAVVDPIIMPLVTAARLTQIVVFILCIGAASSIYPALRAARIDVTEAIKFDR
ncbi:MAG: ABC transporter permease [Acidobacteria bacterium]|nr:ABC transporter permease [Acidobacteriota bacterium]